MKVKTKAPYWGARGDFRKRAIFEITSITAAQPVYPAYLSTAI